MTPYMRITPGFSEQYHGPHKEKDEKYHDRQDDQKVKDPKKSTAA
jgi:hypothetical protein